MFSHEIVRVELLNHKNETMVCIYNMWMNMFLWEFYTCYFNYIDVDYGKLNVFKQSDKGMEFTLKCEVEMLQFS